MKKVIKINVSEGEPYGFTTSRCWDAAYSIIAGSEDVKYISIDIADGIDVVASKIFLPFAGGVRYFVSVPAMNVAISMQPSLLDINLITLALINGGYRLVTHEGGVYAAYGPLSTESAITVAEVLRDLGDF